MKKYQINIPNAIDSQIATAHKQGKFSALLPSQFIKHLITVGLREYQIEIQCEQARRKALLQEAGYKDAPDVTPEPEQRASVKIIPFPGVSIAHEVTYQNALDGFLREIGYIE